MILSVFITVISVNDKPQPSGCLLDLICCFNKLTKKQAWTELNHKWNDNFFIRYDKIRRKRTYTVSYGEKRWLIISLMLTLCKNARLFLLVEPTVGIDIQYRMMLWELINKITADGKKGIY